MGRKFKVIGLALMAVFAFSAFASAAAEAAPNWTVEGKEFTGEAEIAESVTVKKLGTETTASSILTVPEDLQITCTKITADSGKIFSVLKDTVKSLTFETCKVLTSTGGSTVCLVKNKGGTNGSIHTVPLNSELKTVNSVVYDFFSPENLKEENEPFVEIVITECGLEGTFKVTGSVALKPETETNAVELGGEASASIQTAAGAALKFGTHPAVLDAKVGLKLKNGKTWGVKP
jgi:hypothetical protein